MSLTPPRYTPAEFELSAEWMDAELRISHDREGPNDEELIEWAAKFRQAAGQARVLDRLRETFDDSPGPFYRAELMAILDGDGKKKRRG